MNKYKCIVIIASFVTILCACVSERDVSNLGEDTSAAAISTETEEDASKDSTLFIDNVSYDHASSAEYTAHFMDCRKPVDEVIENYETDCKYLADNPQNNFTFNSLALSKIPNISDVSAFLLNEKNCTCEEAFDIIRYWLGKWQLSGDIDLMNTVKDTNRAFKGVDPDNPDRNGYFYAKEVWDLNDGSGFMFIDHDLCYIQMMGNGVGILSHGIVYDYVVEKTDGKNADKTLDTYYLSDNAQTVESGTFDDMADKSYELIDGSINTVREAYDALDGFYHFTDGIGVDVYYVDVLEVYDRYVYCFHTRRTYDGIPFTSMGDGNYYPQLKKFLLEGDIGRLYVAKKGDVSAYLGFGARPIMTQLCEPQTEIIGVRDAMDIVYDVISNEYPCDIDSIELCMGYYKGVTPETAYLAFVPTCWEFRGHSEISDKKIKIDVDVLTGEVGFVEYFE